MQPVATYQYFGLWAFLVLLVGLGFIVWRWPEGKHLTFSQHVALHKHRILYYIVLFSVVLPLLVLFFIGWFVPALRLSNWFGVFIIISALTQFACTLIPEVGGWKTKYHRLLAGTSALCLLPPLGFLLISDNVTTWGKSITAFSLLIMVGIVYVLIKGKGAHRYFLILQSMYFAAFLAPILFITYAR